MSSSAAVEPPLAPLPMVRLDGGEVFSIRDVSIIEDRFVRPDGTIGQYVYTAGMWGVTCIPIARIDGVEHIALVRQYRYPVNEFVLELPGGGAEVLSAANAARELQEETALTASSVTFLGEFFQSPGTTTTKGSAWLCRVADPAPSYDHVEYESGAETEWYSVDRVRQMLKEGKIQSGVTLAALAYGFASGLI